MGDARAPGRHSAAPHDKRADGRGVPSLMALLGLCVLAADLALPRTVDVAALYVLPVVLSIWVASRRVTRWTAVACTAAVVAGALLGPAGGLLRHDLANRAVALFAIWAVAMLGRMRLTAETELRRSRETVATTLASIAEGVITTDAQGRVAFLNRVAEDLLGWSAADARGRPLAELLAGCEDDAAPADAPAHDAASDLLPSAREAVVRRRDGRRLVLEASAAPIPDRASPGSPGFGRVIVFRDVTERRAREEAVAALAYRDPLTGLANRASFEDRLELELAHAQRAGRRLGLAFLDLDGFKEINDTLGHAAGDRLLIEVGARLRGALREEDTVARLGGDEFTVLLPGLACAADAERVVEKLCAALAPPYEIGGREVRARASIGLAVHPDDLAGDPDLERRERSARLVALADLAMYDAKSSGGGRWARAAVAASTGGG